MTVARNPGPIENSISPPNAKKYSKGVIAPLSEIFLLGTTIDYIQEDYTKGIFENKFKFEINKENMTSCGCGISFSPK